MKKHFLQSIFLIILLSSSVFTHAQSLWGETVYGMTPSKVIEVVKGAHTAKNGSTLQGGIKELVRLEDVQIANESFQVKFYFLNEKLCQVTLSLNDKRSWSAAMLVFNYLGDALTSKYGKEISKDIYNGSNMKEAKTVWVNGRSNISLYAVTLGDAPVVLNVNYQTRLSDAASKL